MRAVDTNVLVRLITRDDLHQMNAAEAFVAPGAWVPQLALAEATRVLEAVYDRKPAEIATAVEMLLHHRNLTVQDEDIVRAALDDFRSKPRLGFPGCLMIAVARKAGHLPLGTFDRDLGKRPGAERL